MRLTLSLLLNITTCCVSRVCLAQETSLHHPQIQDRLQPKGRCEMASAAAEHRFAQHSFAAEHVEPLNGKALCFDAQIDIHPVVVGHVDQVFNARVGETV